VDDIENGADLPTLYFVVIVVEFLMKGLEMLVVYRGCACATIMLSMYAIDGKFYFRRSFRRPLIFSSPLYVYQIDGGRIKQSLLHDVF
jgi:hypothetical protein